MNYVVPSDENQKSASDKGPTVLQFACGRAASIGDATTRRLDVKQESECVIDEQRKPKEIVFKKCSYYRDGRGVLRLYPTEPESLADREGLLRFLSTDADAVSEAL